MRPMFSLLPLAFAGGLALGCTEQPATPAGPSFGVVEEPPCDPKYDVCEATGRMTGGGNQITVAGVKVTRGFTIHCDIVLSNNVEVNWEGNQFHLDKPLDAAECIDDPAVAPEPPPAPFDTFIGDGTGRLNGVDGAKIHFTFVDTGEPGGKNDKAAIRITSASGTVVLDVPLTVLTGGNVQAHYDQPHGSHAPH